MTDLLTPAEIEAHLEDVNNLGFLTGPGAASLAATALAALRRAEEAEAILAGLATNTLGELEHAKDLIAELEALEIMPWENGLSERKFRLLKETALDALRRAEEAEKQLADLGARYTARLNELVDEHEDRVFELEDYANRMKLESDTAWSDLTNASEDLRKAKDRIAELEARWAHFSALVEAETARATDAYYTKPGWSITRAALQSKEPR